MFKRIGLFLLTNLAIIAVASIIFSIFNVGSYIGPAGLNYQSLLIFAAVFGFTGSFVSLALSKWMAKRAYSIHIIENPVNESERWLVNKVAGIAQKAGIGMPEVGIYESPEPNAFATGMNKNKALVAVSTGLLHTMNQDEVEGVLGHEVAHVANGDMVTLALIQGVVNTFVIFFARVAAYFVTQFLSGDEEEGGGMSYMAYFVTSIVFEILFGILASVVVMYFSRIREFSADSGSASLVGRPKMIKALQKLQAMTDMPVDKRAPEMATMKINGRTAFMSLFRTHPSIDDRINALKQQG